MFEAAAYSVEAITEVRSAAATAENVVAVENMPELAFDVTWLGRARKASSTKT